MDAAIEVHRTFGPGLFEEFYERCLEIELQHRGLHVEHQVPVPARYRGVDVGHAYKMDLLVERSVIVEVKAVNGLHPRHEAQVLTYLRLSGHPVALLINFNEARLIDGFRRFVG